MRKTSRALSFMLTSGRRARRALPDQRAPAMPGGIGTGTVSAPASKDRIRVRTIVISAPQQEHRNGARGLTQVRPASARAGSNFSTRCSKAISRLQFGCRNPKLRARLKPPLGQHMLQHQPQELRTGYGAQHHRPALRIAITECHLTIRASDDVVLTDHPPVEISPRGSPVLHQSLGQHQSGKRWIWQAIAY